MRSRLALDPICIYGRRAARCVRECLQNTTASKLSCIQQEQRFTTGLHRRAQRVNARQQTGEIEPRRAQFAGVEIVLRFLAKSRFGHQGPHVGVGRVTKHLQILDRRRADFVRIGFRTVKQPRGQFIEGGHGVVQWLGELGEVRAGGRREVSNLVGEQVVDCLLYTSDAADE